MGSKVKDDWFFEKVNGKQFHGKKSECDNFCIRFQIRKKKSYPWSKVCRDIKKQDWNKVFSSKSVCTKNSEKMIISMRFRNGYHGFCQWGQEKDKDNWHFQSLSRKRQSEIISKMLKRRSCLAK